MLTGETRNQVDRIWDAFWSGGISNPLEVIEQITYLLFHKQLDELHLAEELKANRAKKPMERRIFPAGKDKQGMAYEQYRWFALQEHGGAGDVRGDQRARLSLAARSGRRRFNLRKTHGGRPIHDPHACAAGQGGGPDRKGPDGGPGHKGRPL